MNAYPFSLFKRADRSCYSVSFKDQNGKYLRPVSTGKKTENEAMQAAFQMLRDGIPQKKTNTVLSMNDLCVKDMVRKLKDETEVQKVMAELQRSGWVKSYVQKDTFGAVDFVSFLKTFWDWETSPYVTEKRRQKDSIHKRHCSNQTGAINLYWDGFLKGRFLGDISYDDIDAFIKHLEPLNLSAERKNGIIAAGTKPIRWAFEKGKITVDPTRGHTMFSGEKKKRNILTMTSAAAVFKVDWSDERSKLANMLAAVTGMRNGEIVALQFQDLGKDCLYVRNSYNSEDKMKTTKTNEDRIVHIPFPDLMNGLVEQAKQNPWGISPTSLVFWSTTRSKVPMQGRSFCVGLREAMVKVGFSSQEAEQYTFHGWRHFFTSYMVNKLDKKLLKGETGHKTDIMINHYADHKTIGDRELIQAKKLEIFAGLLPEP
ncbi:MAG: tyrosine-type recombinase/integrase, partial [Treponema sp.]|nr:tyrosine-type recombinase/integrase [Treponema sp.]